MAGRAPLELRLTAPAKGDALPIVLLSHGAGPSKYVASKDGYAPWRSSGLNAVLPRSCQLPENRLSEDAPGAPYFWRQRVSEMKTSAAKYEILAIDVSAFVFAAETNLEKRLISDLPVPS
ncbi:putative dienelactone hydrolase domain protein (plasmid) [Ochrobactrum quorumnocens]|uniref:Putative dienelactone hydrolase domain protein n=1 Tax=Ochrobactrum quorumnocens TaxID=271865 RepID=A0A248UNM9_9HYPH|nr:putative dienelactone hydrolase domain protein [[Ochrobactrum] quorumnocens]